MATGHVAVAFLRWGAWFVTLAMVVPTLIAVAFHGVRQATAAPWWAADNGSVGIAPDPRTSPEEIVQVYAARVYGWRGALGVHTWIATKGRDAEHYTRLEVIGWGVRRGAPALRVRPGIPDARWYGHTPVVLAE